MIRDLFVPYIFHDQTSLCVLLVDGSHEAAVGVDVEVGANDAKTCRHILEWRNDSLGSRSDLLDLGLPNEQGEF